MKNFQVKIFKTLFFSENTTNKFAIGALVGLAFSMSVILVTVGLMDGFEKTLKLGLKKSVGDVAMHSREGFFKIEPDFVKIFNQNGVTQFSGIVQSESFLIGNEISRGVIVKGIEESYSKVVNYSFQLKSHEIILGMEIAKLLNLKIGQDVVLAFAKGNGQIKSLPTLVHFTVANFFSHGIYQKDSRIVYIPIKDLQSILELKNYVNLVSFNFDNKKGNESTYIENRIPLFKRLFGDNFYFRPYWREFSPLIEAVKTEKYMISMILQIIVIIAIFNILAFIIFISEKKSKELFLFKALGLSKKKMSILWIKLIFVLWFFSCLLSIIFLEIFKFCFSYFSFFELPSDIYYMPKIVISLSPSVYLLVYSFTLFWILAITFYLLKKLKEKSLLEGLRQEFN